MKQLNLEPEELEDFLKFTHSKQQEEKDPQLKAFYKNVTRDIALEILTSNTKKDVKS